MRTATQATRAGALRSIGLALCSLCAFVPGAHATFPGPDGRLAWSDRALFSAQVGPAPAFLDQLTPTPQVGFQDVAPAWSPKGSRIAFARGEFSSGRRLTTDIWVMKADGTDAVQLTHNGASTDPAWSPDGAQIAYTQNETVWVMNADGTAAHQVVLATSSEPDWSPDGKHLAYIGFQGVLWVSRTDGSNYQPIVNGSPVNNPSWSPDGTRIAFEQGGQVWSVRGDRENLKQLTDVGNGLAAGQPTWSPSGKFLAYVSGDPDFAVGSIWVLDVAKEKAVQLTHGLQSSPSWGVAQPLAGILAEVTAHTWSRSAGGSRVYTVRIDAEEKVNAEVLLLRGDKLISRSALTRLATGEHTLTVKVPRGSRRGSCHVHIVLTDLQGNKRRVKEATTVPAPA